MNDCKLFHYQEPAFQDLLHTAKAFFDPRWHEFSIKPRFSRLIVGPSGVGKTHIVRALAEHLSVPLFSIDVSNWILLGASAAERNGQTWQHISEFIAKNERGIIFLDELDKLGRTGSVNDSAWAQHLRVEVYGLLDGRIPTGLTMPVLEEKEASGTPKELTLGGLNFSTADIGRKFARVDLFLQSGAELEGISRVLLDFTNEGNKTSANQLAERLGRNMLIVGAGAFQPLWEDWSKPRIGIVQNGSEKGRGLKHCDLQTMVPTELTNRFGATPVVIAPLQQKDYRQMLYRTACKLPKDIASHMVRTGIRELEPAIESGLGVRWVESLLLRTLSLPNSLAEGIAPSPGLTRSPH
jgi:SpoVK/Ycf46/Vps4 family AAA+-type ATPase